MASPGASAHHTPLRAGLVSESAMYQSSAVYGTHYGSTTQAKLAPPRAESLKEQTFSEKAAPYVCEFMGTFMLTFIFATCQGGPYAYSLPTAIGAALVVIIYAVGFVSGGHLNPAVSMAFMCSRKMPVWQCVCYMILQLTAGLVAGFFFELVFLKSPFGVMPAAPFSFSEAAMFEFLFTCMLCFVFLNVVASARNNPDHDKNQFFPLAVGFVAIAAGYAGANISGAALNPAIAFGLDLVGGHALYGLYYPLMEFAGAILAAVLFRICRAEDYQQHQSGLHSEELALYVPSLSVRMFSELVGTFFIATTFGLNVIMMSASTGFAVGAALLSLVYALGNLSGAHFNPAVTAAVCLSGRNKCSTQDVLFYWMAQLLGGVMAGTFIQYIHHNGPTESIPFNLGGLSSGYHWGTIMVVEVFFTFILAYTVLAVATCDQYVVTTMRSRQNFYFALAIGFAMCAGVFAAGPVSGGYLNPAAALAFATEAVPNYESVSAVKGWPVWTRPVLQAIALLCRYIAYFGNWMLYFLYELIGATLAAATFRLTHPAEYLQKAPMLISYVQHVPRTD